MVEISYREYSQQADLVGKSVAEARERYKDEFDIPDQAKASLNGKQVKRKLEPETKLNGDDKLIFAEKSRRGLVLVGTLLAALMATGGMFGYTYTTATMVMGLTAAGDIAVVEPRSYAPAINVFGHYKGYLPEGWLFEIDPDDAYTGDLTITVSLLNPGELSHVYKYINLKLEITDDNETRVSGNSGHEFEALSLDNGVVTFDVPYTAIQPYKVHLLGGGYCTLGQSPLPWVTPYSVSPELFCEVTAREY